MRRPDGGDAVGVAVLNAVPELAAELLGEEEDDGLCGHTALALLAGTVERLLAEEGAFTTGRLGGDGGVVHRCAVVVEDLALDGWVQEVGWSFLDALAPESLAALLPTLGPRTLWILDNIDDLDEGAPLPRR